MSILARIEKHEQLVNRMAQRAGADMDLALQTGAVSPGELRAAVLACTGCTDPEDCLARLNAGTAGIPAYCRNADMFASIAEVLGNAD